MNGARGTIWSIISPHQEVEGVSSIVLAELHSYCGPPMLPDEPSLMPSVFAWATTIHKAQGLTLSKVTVDL